MNSNEVFQGPHTLFTRRIVLTVQGLSAVPSMKNSKMLTRGKLITKPETQKWMERAIRSIESQLTSLTQTIEGETLTAQQRRSLIALSMPVDDSWQWVPEIRIMAHKVPKGHEGATITIERIQ